MPRSLPVIAPLLSILLLTPPVLAARRALVQVDPQVVQDCRVEGQALGMAGAALEGYVRECVRDFYDTHVTVTPLPRD